MGVDNLWGWFIALAAYGVFWWLLGAKNREPAILWSGFVVLFAHHLLSWANIAFGPLIFAKYDAWGFHLFASKFAGDPDQLEWAIGTSMYKSILLLLYDSLGKSLWMAQNVSVLAFSVSMAALVWVFRRVDINYTVIIGAGLLVYGLAPSGWLYGSINLREPFMTLFFIVGCASALKGFQQRSVVHILLACVCWVAMGLFHQVMMIYGFVGALMTVFVYSIVVERQGIKGYALLGAMILAGFGVFTVLPSTGGDNYFQMLFDSIPQSVFLYRNAGESSAPITGYATSFDFSNWAQMMISLVRSYFYYFGWPVSGDYALLSTWVLMADALVRVVALLAVGLLWRDRRVWWLILVYLSLTFIWNIGSTNHGQALRHHVMSNWLLIVCLAMVCQHWYSQRGRGQ